MPKAAKVVLTVRQQTVLDGSGRRPIGKLLTVNLPIPRTDGRFIQNAGNKVDLRFFIARHLAFSGYGFKFDLA